MKFFLLFILFSSLPLRAEECEQVDSGLPAEFLSDFGKVEEKLREKILKRDLASNNIKFLEISSNFVPPTGEIPYFGRLYYNSQNPDEIRIRDSLTAERKYKEEKNLNNPSYCMSVMIPELRSKNGADLMNVPSAELTLKAVQTFTKGKDGKMIPDKPFSVKYGGQLDITFKIPFQKARQVKLFFKPEPNGKIRKFYITPDGQKVEFDRMTINANKGVFGGPSILAGIRDIEFQNGTKPAYVFK